mmetsp:Transcript_32853/g.69115  ORF Transcript_32853/g.69115 Transcript_32853/m.69115 type:complete len:377 (+) Transcript_32853:299-1429(+)|eukprot:CAMPEP_0172322594 /NCGR_PEP_ID=MMETSP1058-20130122/46325_1 /TAXON_ID=83371 /ORGANISM="Detonula confervacea, Strain CCMP 353" /LENGTH=376 /DNA_ID=CAMNT_0013038373 /DNA_START=292 /DNA_END=1422 /DNA_ORIENTATION=-
MSTNENEASRRSASDMTENSYENDDTLAPLPDDLLTPAPPSRTPLSSSSAGALNGLNTTATSKRRSVEAESGRPIFPIRNPTKQDLIHARKIVENLQTEHGFVSPDRGNLDDPSIIWKEGKPDYTIADMHYLLGKTRNHPPGSLELSVENLIKTWEMEATHKEFYQWTTVDQNEYEVQANGGKVFSSEEAPWVGNYNWLLSTCSTDLYDSAKETFESSHGKFRYAFPEGFPFEVLEVFSGPPKVTFTWRHWAVFSGQYEGNQGNGATINMTGFGIASLNEDSKVTRLEIYYDPDSFLEVLRGKKECRDGIDRGAAVGEPIAGGLESLACMMSAIEIEEEETESGDNGGGRSTETIEGEKHGGKPSGRCPFSGATRS